MPASPALRSAPRSSRSDERTRKSSRKIAEEQDQGGAEEEKETVPPGILVRGRDVGVEIEPGLPDQDAQAPQHPRRWPTCRPNEDRREPEQQRPPGELQVARQQR